MNFDLIREHNSLVEEKTELNARLRAIQQRLEEIEGPIVNDFINEGIQSTKIDGRTVYIARDVFTSPGEGLAREDVAKALDASNLEGYASLNYNSQSLDAYVREVMRDLESAAQPGDPPIGEEQLLAALPEPLRETVKVSFRHRIRSRKG